LANRIRALLLDPKNRIEPHLELLLYEVARRDHVERIIRPALERGEVVLCDRFTDATLAYQGYGRKIPLPLIESLNQEATSGLRPTLTFLFDLPILLGLNRAYRSKGHWDRLEREDQQFHQRVRRGYLTLAAKEKRRFCVVDTRQPREEVRRKVRSAVQKVL
jgi:dTMP kinase